MRRFGRQVGRGSAPRLCLPPRAPSHLNWKNVLKPVEHREEGGLVVRWQTGSMQGLQAEIHHQAPETDLVETLNRNTPASFPR